MLTKCARCATLFNRVGAEGLCPECENEAADFARRIDDFLAYHNTRDAGRVVAATGVPRTFVITYLTGHSQDAAIQAGVTAPRACVRCGAPASVGPHCQRCAIEVRQQVHTVAEEAQETKPPSRASIAVDRRERTTGGGRATPSG